MRWPDKGRYTVEHRVVWPDGSVHWIHGSGQVTLGPDGEVNGAIGFTADVTAQVTGRHELRRLTGEALEAARHERRGRERLEALGRINDALAESRERDVLLRNVTAAAVPALGDTCAIYVLNAGSADVTVEVAHRDQASTPGLRAELLGRTFDPRAPSGVPRAIRTGRARAATYQCSRPDARRGRGGRGRMRRHRDAAGQAGPGGRRPAPADRPVVPHATKRTTSRWPRRPPTGSPPASRTSD